MYRPTSPQSSIFEVQNFFPEALPENDWCFTYQEKVLPLIDEEKFRHLYSESEGRPNASIKTTVSLLIFMGMEKLTWRGVEFQFPRRLDWLISTNTPLGEAQIDHTTLFKFYQRLETDDTARDLFTDTTDAFTKACGTSLKKV
ncbi:MAG: transposase [bacterium]|nr:transposase [bacterium]